MCRFVCWLVPLTPPWHEPNTTLNVRALYYTLRLLLKITIESPSWVTLWSIGARRGRPPRPNLTSGQILFIWIFMCNICFNLINIQCVEVGCKPGECCMGKRKWVGFIGGVKYVWAFKCFEWSLNNQCKQLIIKRRCRNWLFYLKWREDLLRYVSYQIYFNLKIALTSVKTPLANKLVHT